ncbi:hemagglutinin repeat-containing protein [Lysobacter sp. CA196]|uniref:hemagglutinin repeat-containing protein n=1 Tax=Lysobacter sp. CA196 TaxID=3455606 RepID=UPI003F8CF4CF
MNLTAAQEQHDYVQDSTTKKKGTLSSTTTKTHDEAMDSYAIGTSLSGEKVAIRAGNVVTVQGSDVVSTYGTVISGNKGVEIVHATDESTSAHASSKKTSGVFGNGGASFTIGSKKKDVQTESSSSTVRGAMVGSLLGDTTILANDGTVHIQGSTVSSPEGGVAILGQAVNIEEAYNTSAYHEVTKTKQGGLTVGASAPIVDAAMAAYGSAKTVGQSKDGRINAMAAANTAYNAYQMAGAASAAMSGQAASVSITVGQQRSKSELTSSSSEVVGSSVNAGERVDIVATGAGQDSDIRVSGSEVIGGTGTGLYADDAIDILAAQSTHEQRTENSSSGWNVGVGISVGAGGMSAGITAGVNAGKGHSDGKTVTNVNSHVGGGGTTALTSGGATTIRGGQVLGDRVEVDAAQLAIESLQDTESYASKQMDASVQVTVGFGASVSASYSQSKVDSNYASVAEQSGILAGDGGYAVNVRGNTDLKGGIITSTQTAEDAGRNSFTTGTLTASDIRNRAEYEGTAFGVSGSYGKNGDGEQGKHQTAQGSADGKAGGTSANKSLGFGSDDGSQNSVTASGINTRNITITDGIGQAATGKTAEQIKAEVATTTGTDTVAANSGALVNKFDADVVQKELDLQVQVTQTFDRTQQGVRNEINASIDDARQRQKDANAALKDPDLNLSGAQRSELLAMALDAQREVERLQKVGVLVSAIAGGLSTPANSAAGVAASTLAPGASYLVGQYFKDNTAKNMVDGGSRSEEGSATHLLVHSLLGAAVAASGGNNALIAGIAAGGAEAAAPALAQYLYGKEAKDLSAEEKSTVSAIVGIGGATLGAFGSDISSLIASGTAAQNAVDNNWGEVGHYSTMATVLYLAGFSETDAKAVALAAWSPDTDKRNAMTIDNFIFAGLDSGDEQQRIHLLDGETDPAKVAAVQRTLAAEVTAILTKLKQYDGDPVAKAGLLTDPEVQRVLHSFGDSFAHVQRDGTHYSPMIGHARDSVNQPDPDNPYSHQEAYLDYTLVLYGAASKASGGPVVPVSQINRLATEVASHEAESAQKNILEKAMRQAGGQDVKGLVSSPVSECGLRENCTSVMPSNTANPVLRNISDVKQTARGLVPKNAYQSPLQSVLEPTIRRIYGGEGRRIIIPRKLPGAQNQRGD